MKCISFFCQAISFFFLCFFITYYFILVRLISFHFFSGGISLFCQAYFIILPGLFHCFARLISLFCQAYFISLPELISFLAMPICLAMMGSISKTCDLLFASIYMLIVQLTYIMTSNANKYKNQMPGVSECK